MVSLLLRHGANAGLCNRAHQRPVDVAASDDVIQLLSRGEHLQRDDDVTAASVTSHGRDVTAASTASHDEPLDSGIC